MMICWLHGSMLWLPARLKPRCSCWFCCLACFVYTAGRVLLDGSDGAHMVGMLPRDVVSWLLLSSYVVMFFLLMHFVVVMAG